MTARARAAAWLVVAVVAVRVGAASWAAVSNIRGDYYASLPGAYVQTVNPTLWNSPDMEGAWGYHVDTYFHGPVQYLTLYPVAYLDSYAAIAQVLLPIYAVVLAVAFWLVRGAVLPLIAAREEIDHRAAGGTVAVLRSGSDARVVTLALLGSTFLFFPLLQAYIQREFEVVIYAALAGALWLLVRDRRGGAAAVLAYVAWFKYVPLMFGAYLGLRRWWSAVAGFALTSAAILALADAVFGLELFVNNNVPRHAAQVFNLWGYGFEPGLHGYLYGTGFCYGWIEIETTLANVRHGLCSLAFRAPWLPPHVIYLALCVAVAAVYLTTHFRLERAGGLTQDAERWRRALEFSIVATVYVSFFFNHYYYLIVLAIPLDVLLVRYLTARRWRALALWGVAYLLLSAFVVPTSVLSRLSGADVWAFYIKGAWFLWGELLLVGLLLAEYWALSRRRLVTIPDVSRVQHARS